MKHPNKGNKGVRGAKILRRIVKNEIVKQNIFLFDTELHHEYRLGKWHNLDTPGRREIVQLFRSKLGYSPKTADVDILWQAKNAYDRFKAGIDITRHIMIR